MEVLGFFRLRRGKVAIFALLLAFIALFYADAMIVSLLKSPVSLMYHVLQADLLSMLFYAIILLPFFMPMLLWPLVALWGSQYGYYSVISEPYTTVMFVALEAAYLYFVSCFVYDVFWKRCEPYLRGLRTEKMDRKNIKILSVALLLCALAAIPGIPYTQSSMFESWSMFSLHGLPIPFLTEETAYWLSDVMGVNWGLSLLPLMVDMVFWYMLLRFLLPKMKVFIESQKKHS